MLPKSIITYCGEVATGLKDAAGVMFPDNEVAQTEFFMNNFTPALHMVTHLEAGLSCSVIPVPAEEIDEESGLGL